MKEIKVGDVFQIGLDSKFHYRVTDCKEMSNLMVRICFTCVYSQDGPCNLGQQYNGYSYFLKDLNLIEQKAKGHKLTKLFK